MTKAATNIKKSVSKSALIAKEFQKLDRGIGGGMQPEAALTWAYLLAVQSSHEIVGSILEIGVFEGKGCYIPSAMSHEEEAIFLVDISRYYLDKAEEFIKATSPIANKIKKIHCDSISSDWEKEFNSSNYQARWVHIDGEHSYAGVYADLTKTARVACRDCIICVDDVDLAVSPCIYDAVQDWLKAHRDYRLILRGFNKAYIASTRTSIAWSSYIEMAPDVFEIYYNCNIMLSSQTSSSESPYYSISKRVLDPVSKYSRVMGKFSSYRSFKGVNPSSYLLPCSTNPNVLLFGNCQMRVLGHALRALKDLTNMKIDVRYVNDVHLLESYQIDQLKKEALHADFLVGQHVQGSRFGISTEDLLQANSSITFISVPSMYFDGWWPSHLNLLMDPNNNNHSPVDAVIYRFILEGLTDQEISKKMTSPDIIKADIYNNHWKMSLERLNAREESNQVTIKISQFLDSSGIKNRLFHTFNHPKKEVFDWLSTQIFGLLQSCYASSDLNDVFENTTTDHSLPYDMSSIDFIDFPALPSVRLLTQVDQNQENLESAFLYRRPRLSCGFHARISLLAYIAEVRSIIEALSVEQQRANAERVYSSETVSAVFENDSALIL